MHFISQLPSQLNLTDFINGKYFTTEQSKRILRAIAVCRDINYEHEMTEVKRFLNKAADTFIGQNIVSVKSELEVSQSTKLLIVRFINIVYKARMPIVINDEIVYIPKSIESFDDKEIQAYIEACMRSVRHSTSVKVDIISETVFAMTARAVLVKSPSKVYDVPSARKSNVSNMYNTKEQATV